MVKKRKPSNFVAPADLVRAAVGCLAKEKDPRQHLRYIHFRTDGTVEATNGQVAFFGRARDPELFDHPQENILIDVGTTLPNKADELFFKFVDHTHGVIHCTSNSDGDFIEKIAAFSVPEIEPDTEGKPREYPRIEDIVKKGAAKVNQIALNGENLNAVKKCYGKHPARFMFNGVASPVVVTCDHFHWAEYDNALIIQTSSLVENTFDEPLNGFDE